jgi:hypothetical protein
MLGDGLPDAFDTRGSSRPRTETAVQSTTSIWHCRAPAGAAASIHCPTPWCLGEIARGIAISQSAAPLIMGCSCNFRRVPSPLPSSPQGGIVPVDQVQNVFLASDVVNPGKLAICRRDSARTIFC